MNVYRPENVPEQKLPPPMIWGEDYYVSHQPPESLWNDGEIRRGMEFALRMQDGHVHEITKILRERKLDPLLSVQVSFPYERLPAVFRPGCMREEQERENVMLKNYVFDAYDALAEYFADAQWRGWFVAPYFSECDDTYSTCNLGIFVDEQLSSEMVE